MLHAVIMAGGSGTRLWPESRKNFPKQLMTLAGNRSFLQAAVDRLVPAVKYENIRIVTGKNLKAAVETQVPELSPDAILAEPCARNTAACIAFAAVMCLAHDPEAVMAILPSDHIIQPAQAFQRTLLQAAEIVQTDAEKLVTLGIPPAYPAESFGYIERGKKYEQQKSNCVSKSKSNAPTNAPPNAAVSETPVFTVRQFHEKPDRKTAETYIQTGNYDWNAGIFIWKASAILENLKRYTPGVFGPIETIQKAVGKPEFSSILESEFPKIENISIDYAVIEKAAKEGRVLVLPAPFSWDDAGSWRALERYFPEDSAQNTVSASAKAPVPLPMETHDCTLRNTDPSKTLVCYGVHDLTVIVTPDVVLVCDRNCEESIRNVTKKLQEMNCEDLL